MSRRWIPLLALAAACTRVGAWPPDAPPFRQPPVDHVDVYTWPGIVEVGDTITVSADGFDSTGYVTEWSATRRWTLSDSTLVTVSASAPPQESMILTGRQPGVVTLTVKIDSATGSSTLRVIPVLAPITTTPDSLTFRQGDSARVVVHVTDLAGQRVDGVTIMVTPVTFGIAYGACCKDTLWIRSVFPGGQTGTTLMRVQVGHETGTFPVTVTAP